MKAALEGCVSFCETICATSRTASTLCFLHNFQKQFRRQQEYTAPGSFAVGVDFQGVVRRAGALQDNNLLATAAELDRYPFYSRFHLDSASCRQVGHRIRLIQWEQDRKVYRRPETPK